jgi:hypothetical protein
MFTDLKVIIAVLYQALDLRSGFIRRKRKREALSDLLTLHFCVSRVIENGRELLEVAGKQSIQKVLALPPDVRLRFSSKVYSLLQTQRLLLRKSVQLIRGQPIMNVCHPSCDVLLLQLRGGKTIYLQTLANAFETYFRFEGRLVLNKVNEEEHHRLRDQIGVVGRIFPQHSEDIIDVETASKNIDILERFVEELRAKIDKHYSFEEQLELVKKAEEAAKAI